MLATAVYTVSVHGPKTRFLAAQLASATLSAWCKSTKRAVSARSLPGGADLQGAPSDLDAVVSGGTSHLPPRHPQGTPPCHPLASNLPQTNVPRPPGRGTPQSSPRRPPGTSPLPPSCPPLGPDQCAPSPTGGGTPPLPPTVIGGYVLHESTACAQPMFPAPLQAECVSPTFPPPFIGGLRAAWKSTACATNVPAAPAGRMVEWHPPLAPTVIGGYDAHCHEVERTVPNHVPAPLHGGGGGTPHLPPTVIGGYVLHESTACAQYLLGKGCSAQSLLKEVSSYDTVGNAYFALTIHAIPANWRKIAVVTSDFHMPRSKALFEDMFGLAARDLFNDAQRYSLHFFKASDEGIFEDDILQVRHEKEAQSVENWKTKFSQMDSLPALHAWLHDTHQCYSVSRQHEFAKKTISDPRLLASY
eukprot:gene30408-35413_t